MRYLRMDWLHDYEVEPVVFFHEVDPDGWEMRRVLVFRDGRTAWADAQHETDTVGLSLIPIETTAQINSDEEGEEFRAADITREEFEHRWAMAREETP